MKVLFALILQMLAILCLLWSAGCASRAGYLPQIQENVNAGTAGTSWDVWPDGRCTVTVRIPGTPLARANVPEAWCVAMKVAKDATAAASAAAGVK